MYPLRLPPLEILKWAVENGAEGVAFSGLDPDDRKLIDDSYLKDLAQFAGDHDLYIEWGGGQHIPRDTNSWDKKDLFKINEQAAGEAEALGTRIVRSCSGGLMRWNPDNPSTETLLRETAKALKAQRGVLKDHNVILAIETHFEFTTFELKRLLEMCEAEPGDCFGICLDTMNLLTMLEDPVSATERILPWVVSTHIKDGAILLTADGLITFPTPIGKGIVDIKGVIDQLNTLEHEINLSVEDHGGDFHLPIYDQRFLSEFPDLTADEYAKLMELAKDSELKVKKGECGIVERERWGDVCENRVRADIIALRKIRNNC